jgi:signal transduction histidine kinase
VLINLLANAAQHTPEGSTITVECEAADTEAVLRVCDNGPGIPGEALPHLFERFYRADKARSRAAGGSGLGLSIAHSIVRAHGGELSAENPPGGGAGFTMRMPLERTDPQDPA